MEDGSRPFRVYCEASIYSFGATLEQEQPDGSVRPIPYVIRATLDSERHWTPLDLEASSIVWAIKRLRGYLWGTKFRIFLDHKALENIGKVEDHNARDQRWLEYLAAFDYIPEYRKGSANGNADFPSRLPQPATEHDRSGSSRLTPVDIEDIHLFRACGLLTPSTSLPRIGLGGLVPQPDSAILGGLPLTSTEFRDFHAHGPRMRIDDLSAPTEKFVACVLLSSVLVMTASAARHFGLPPTPLSLRFSRCPTGLLRQTYFRGPLGPHQRLQWHCRLRAASPLGRAEDQPLRPAPRSLPLTMVSDPAGFRGRLPIGSTLHRAFRALGCLWLRPRANLEPQCWSRRCPPRLTATERNLWVSRFQGSRSLRSPPPPLRPIWTPSALLPNYTLVIRLRVIRTPTGRESNLRSLRATPPYNAFFSAGHWPCPPTS